ncbi:methylthioribose kinase [[Bacillus] enclensis]|jgi:hypothetical protein|uniref:HTH merR-type domain-containing protein n=2 Tax=Rossellomorea TaxID=2837508 RepID=A0A0V8HIE7_9BACI|nr:hypothetical protein [[Bacillus] enclensis]OAT83348.1 methylthioribose kinase [Bacillus sp. MKU004]QTC42301.1 methylthioribose kinase [Bacillus sp. V3]QWC24364.1 methylthioribose kinase [Bacillus haikouensis]KSU62403.1 methylthioribose kinase [[Bacillus] enclensis]MBH9968829.1 methylthioribose kinase [[Bacillus] enclensis]
MIQRFIELGEGLADIYELLEMTRYNKERVQHLMAFHTIVKDRPVTSLGVVMKPAAEGKFQAIYICREGIPNPNMMENKRFSLFEQTAKELEKMIIQLDVKPSSFFPEKDLYYQHLIAILRLNHYISPLQ